MTLAIAPGAGGTSMPPPMFTASPTTIEPPPPPSPARPPLPDRNVTLASIEDAYIAFIFHCNPAVSLETETAALREAFRTPPKSGGKSFSTFTLFELIKKLDTKELKTWAELALKLGVEPPDQEKGQSSQKIQQYAVRLKRWMHSMHVDAFFEYLMDRPHPYWTEIPPASTPVIETGRDGVAAEDDMALRALLPHIKPRRGRKKPEEDGEAGRSPPQRPSPLNDEYPVTARPEENEPWSAHPTARGSVFLFPPAPDPNRLNPSAGQPPAWGSNDVAQTPLTATPLTAYPHPQSAITPITRSLFWADLSEPRSAITPSKPRSTSRRHGAKVVSSAWRSTGSTGKTRGRPPINRGANPDGPFSAFPAISEAQTPTFKLPSPTPDRQIPHSAVTPTTTSIHPPEPPHLRPSEVLPPPAPPVTPHQVINQPSPVQETASGRPAKRSRLSLQVPERVGGEVRLATPPLPLTAPPTAPPVVMVNGQAHDPSNNDNNNNIAHDPAVHHSPLPLPPGTKHPAGVDGLFEQVSRTPHLPPGPGSLPMVSFQDPTDRTNLDSVEDFFVHNILTAEWYDPQGAPIPACGIDEATGLGQTVIENLLRSAATKEAFLINLSALVGGQMLMPRNALKITRLETPEGVHDQGRYLCQWELRYGDIKGIYAMEEVVLSGKWKRGEQDGTGEGERRKEDEEEAERWQGVYKEIAEVMTRRDEELMRLRRKVMDCMRKGS